jgi:peroxiredoxin
MTQMTESYVDAPAGVSPAEDNAAAHLPGREVPELPLATSAGGQLDLAAATEQLAVVYVYPRTGVPGEPLPDGWDEIPGARGCTPQSCAFRDHMLELAAYGATVVGLSAQPSAEQREFAARERIPYPLLSDPGMALAQALGLPTFETGGRRYYRRLTFVARRRRIAKVFYPVHSPRHNPSEVLDWLAQQPHGAP